MEKEDILKASRKENKNKDLVELENNTRAHAIAGGVGILLCSIISFVASRIGHIMLYSPWVIYFGMFGTYNLVLFFRRKRKNDITFLVMALFFLGLAVYAFVELIRRLREMNPV